MPEVELLNSLDQIRLLSDPRRLEILRRLMDAPATLTHLGKAMGEHPAWVRHHLKQLADCGLVEMVTTQVSGGFIEKYYQARAQAFVFQQMILPQALLSQETLVLMGSHDLALERLAEHLKEHAHLNLFTLAVGSLDGLVALRQGAAHLTGCHLVDVESGDFNLPYVRRFFPDQDILLATLAERTQGLMVAAGNPHHLRGIEDLARPDVTLVNRNRGSGTRLWLDHAFHRLGLPAARIRGYTSEQRTHTAAAQAILSKQADAALGVEAAARQAGLDFVPLFEERYELVLPGDTAAQPGFLRLLDALADGAFRKRVAELPGYRAGHTGDLRPA